METTSYGEKPMENNNTIVDSMKKFPVKDLPRIYELYKQHLSFEDVLDVITTRQEEFNYYKKLSEVYEDRYAKVLLCKNATYDDNEFDDRTDYSEEGIRRLIGLDLEVHNTMYKRRIAEDPNTNIL